MAKPEIRIEPRANVEAAPERSSPDGLGSLVRALADDATLLARQEIALAKREVTDGAAGLATGGGLMAAGLLLVAGGVLTLIVFLVIALGLLLDDRYWLSSLIVALAFLVAGGGVALHGKRKLNAATLAPEETKESIRETRDWAANEAESLRRELSS